MVLIRAMFMSLQVAAVVGSCGVALSAETKAKTVAIGDLTIDMVYVSAGEFEMGRDRGTAVAAAALSFEAAKGANEGPKRRISLTRGYYIGRYKVTCEQFCAFLNDSDRPETFVDLNRFSRIEHADGKYRPKKGCERSAANVVEWAGAVAFCDWLSAKTGAKFRLPTEAEWEYAARGKEGSRHPWGNSERQPEVATFEACRPVDEKNGDETPDGVAGMGSGWIYEWCNDLYGVRYLPEDVVNPSGPTKEQLPVKSDNPLIATTHGEYRVLRGRASVATRRFLGDRVGGNGIYGLRVVMETKNGQR
jgi:formylglycine-generating enzyme required for sulfatase activity